MLSDNYHISLDDYVVFFHIRIDFYSLMISSAWWLTKLSGLMKGISNFMD
jgi:hypothetical protein